MSDTPTTGYPADKIIGWELAILRGDEYDGPPEHRHIWDRLAAQISAMPPGVIVDIPPD